MNSRQLIKQLHDDDAHYGVTAPDFANGTWSLVEVAAARFEKNDVRLTGGKLIG